MINLLEGRLLDLKRLFIPVAGLALLEYFVTRYLVLGRLTSLLAADDAARSPFFPVLRLLLALGAAFIFSALMVRGRVDVMVLLSILALPLVSRYNMAFVTFYEDVIGLPTSLNPTSLLLLASAATLVVRDRHWLRLAAQSPLFRPLLLLIMCGFVTQILNLGLKAGFGVTYVRVVQPAMFVLLVAYVARSRRGIQLLFSIVVASLCIAILVRMGSTEPVPSATGRVNAIGSWTIYGTILAASLPMCACLWITGRHHWMRLALLGAVILILFELYGTQTRGAVLSLAALGLFALEKRSKWLVAIAATSALALVVGLGWSTSITEWSGGRQLVPDLQVMLSEANTTVRLERNSWAWQYMISHPITGLGLGSPTAESGFDIALWVYNPYLAWGVAMGLPAFIAFARLMLIAVAQAWQNWRAGTGDVRVLNVGVTVCLLMWIVNQFTTGDSLTYMQSMESVLYFWMVIGMILGQHLAMSAAATGPGAKTLWKA